MPWCSTRRDGRVCGTDPLEHVEAVVAAKLDKPITAQNIYAVSLGYLVPELFEPNRRRCLPLRPQHRRTLSARCDAEMFSVRSLSRSHDEVTRGLEESVRLRHVIDHECRKRFSHIQRDVMSLLNRLADVQATALEGRNETVPMGLGRHHEDRVPGLQNGGNKIGKAIKKLGFIRIEQNLV